MPPHQYFYQDTTLEGLPTKTKEDPSPHEMILYQLDINPVFTGYYIIIIFIIIIIIIIIIINEREKTAANKLMRKETTKEIVKNLEGLKEQNTIMK